MLKWSPLESTFGNRFEDYLPSLGPASVSWDLHHTFRQHQLSDHLHIAASNASESLKAGDWDLVLKDLSFTVKDAKIFQLEITAEDGRRIAGPIGDKPIGLGRICGVENADHFSISISGCTRLLSLNDCVILIIFAVLGAIFFYLAIALLERRLSAVLDDVAHRLTIIGLAPGHPNTHIEKQLSSLPIQEVQTIEETVLRLIEEVKIQTESAAVARNEAEKIQALNEFATQVSHDIRSPIASLLALPYRELGMDPPMQAIMRNSIVQIQDIANSLLVKNRRKNALIGANSHADREVVNYLFSDEARGIRPLRPTIERVVSEKRMQHRFRNDLVIETDFTRTTYEVFSSIQPNEFSRVISNLVNNSIEAMEKGGLLQVRLECLEKFARLSFKDSGKGIPQELLSKVIERGGTYGKRDGNGLGLSHAKLMTESWGGKFLISSIHGQGTTIIVELPLAPLPDWHLSNLRIPESATIVVIDDNKEIHSLWTTRLSKLVPEPTLLHFYTEQQALEWFRKQFGHIGSALYLVDYDLKAAHTGLDLINMMGILSDSILVTNRADDAELQQICEKLGLRLLSKSRVSTISIERKV